MPKFQLAKIKRLPVPPLSPSAISLFKTTSAEVRRIEILRAKLQPRPSFTLTKSMLQGKERTLGFKLIQVQGGKCLDDDNDELC